MKVLLAVLFLSLASGTSAQRLLRGQVFNGETGQVLPFANVFLANTTKGTTTDENGNFTLRNLPAGRYDLVVSYVGFETFSFPVQTDTVRFYKILLKPQANELAGVTVRARRDPAWFSRLQTFKTQFIGQSANARQCRLLNPDVLWFLSDSVYSLQAHAREPLQLENRALGYHITYQLERFTIQGFNRIISYLGYPVFQEMTPRNARQRRRWTENRRKAYAGSAMHFMRSLHRRHVREEGFVLNKIVRNQQGSFLLREPLPYPQFIDEAQSDRQRTRLRFSDYLQVVYSLEKEPPAYRARLENPPTRGQTSTLHLVGPGVTVEASGTYYEPLDLLFEGYWAWEKMAELLPLDYEPEE
jgi:hypothetical protein